MWKGGWLISSVPLETPVCSVDTAGVFMALQQLHLVNRVLQRTLAGWAAGSNGSQELHKKQNFLLQSIIKKDKMTYLKPTLSSRWFKLTHSPAGTGCEYDTTQVLQHQGCKLIHKAPVTPWPWATRPQLSWVEEKDLKGKKSIYQSCFSLQHLNCLRILQSQIVLPSEVFNNFHLLVKCWVKWQSYLVQRHFKLMTIILDPYQPF